MGTPDFAVEALRCLVEGGYNVVGVITMPDKPAGRGHKIQYSPVKQYALDHQLPLLQPEKLKDAEFVQALREWKADLQIVVAFRMLPEVVWNMPCFGTFNLHASLLPQYRGAAPINWAVINGDTETGITTFFLKHEIDTGEVIQQVRVPIADTDNVEVVHDKLMQLGGRLVIETVLVELDGQFQHLLLFFVVQIVIAQHMAQFRGCHWYRGSFQILRVRPRSVVRQVGRNLGEDGHRLIDVLSSDDQRRGETQRIRSHRIDDETVFQSPVHGRMRAGVGKFDGVEQATATHGDE